MSSVSKFTSSPWPGNPNASPGEVGIILNKSILPGSTLNSVIITSLSFILSITPVNHQQAIFEHAGNNSPRPPNEVIMELLLMESIN